MLAEVPPKELAVMFRAMSQENDNDPMYALFAEAFQALAEKRGEL